MLRFTQPPMCRRAFAVASGGGRPSGGQAEAHAPPPFLFFLLSERTRNGTLNLSDGSQLAPACYKTLSGSRVAGEKKKRWCSFAPQGHCALKSVSDFHNLFSAPKTYRGIRDGLHLAQRSRVSSPGLNPDSF